VFWTAAFVLLVLGLTATAIANSDGSAGSRERSLEDREWRVAIEENPWAQQLQSTRVIAGRGNQLVVIGDPVPFGPSGQAPAYLLDATDAQMYRLPRSPILAGSQQVAVWPSDHEVIVWGGLNTDGFGSSDGATFNTSSQRWTDIAPAPLRPRRRAAAVWTGREMIVWGGQVSAFGSDKPVELLGDGARYRPSDDSWAPMAAAPMTTAVAGEPVWTGTEAVFVVEPEESGDYDEVKLHQRFIAYNPRSDSWRVVVPHPDMEAVGGLVRRQVMAASSGNLYVLDIRGGVWELRSGRQDWVRLSTIEHFDPMNCQQGSIVIAAERLVVRCFAELWEISKRPGDAPKLVTAAPDPSIFWAAHLQWTGTSLLLHYIMIPGPTYVR
jgi:hypothetical protein